MSKQQEFKVGDRVEFTENYGTHVKCGDRGTVQCVEEPVSQHATSLGATQLVHVPMDDSNFTAISLNVRMKLIERPVAVEAEADPQPVHYRICINNLIGTTEYPSVEAAKDEAIKRGVDGEQFAIFECVKVSDYRVKVTTSLEAI